MRAGVSCESHIKGYYDENLSGKAFVRFHFLTDVGMVSCYFITLFTIHVYRLHCMCHHTYNYSLCCSSSGKLLCFDVLCSSFTKSFVFTL